MSLRTPVEVSDWVVKTTFGLTVHRARAPRRPRAGSTFSPHSKATCSRSAPKASQSSAQRSPNLPQEATSAGSPGRVRLATADSSAPEPVEAKQRTSLLGPEDLGQPLEDALVDLDEGGSAVVEDRLGHHLRDGGRKRRRARGHQVLLRVDIGHRAPRFAFWSGFGRRLPSPGGSSRTGYAVAGTGDRSGRRPRIYSALQLHPPGGAIP